MSPEDFHYPELQKRLAPLVEDGWAESESFVLWFLLNVFRLDETVAQDAICDGFDDKGVDAIYVDNDEEVVYVFQSKLTQKVDSTLGDTDLKEFLGSLHQFSTPEKIIALIEGGARKELVQLINDGEVINKIGSGYQLVGVFLTNRAADANAHALLAANAGLELYDRQRLSESVLDVDFDRSVDAEHSFSTSYAGLLEFQSGEDVTLAIAPVLASELIQLQGISDGTLFQRNVRLSLGTTPVNKAIAGTVKDKAEHNRFVLYHNGITLLCNKMHIQHDEERLVIEGYSVVNGAQSLSTLYNNAKSITSDLRVLVKFISLKDEELSDRITWNSNNQNAIKYRDQRSNDATQRRLQAEFAKVPDVALEIKRGEKVDGKKVLSNEEAGLLLLAYDLEQPWVCHQKYKVFDELYSELFCRPTITAFYISFVHRLMSLVEKNIDEVQNERVRRYALTRYFLLYCLRQALAENPIWENIRADPTYATDPKRWPSFEAAVDEILVGLISDLNGEIDDAGEAFDHKDVFKSPQKSKALARTIVDVYRKELKRKKVDPIDL